ncbi:MAG TPA: tetratricopeptide repeat protein, partial [Thermoanaerobaculia bacterium]|nr:tetratricopeptide repeat protein [Thermoanaerobaculia bacterium]
RAAGLDPAHATGANPRGTALRDPGRRAQAEAAYRRAAELAPAYADPWNGLGALALERGDPRTALERFDRAGDLAPKQHEVRLNRAVALSMLGEVEAATAELRGFLDATAGDSSYAAQRGAAAQLLAALGAPREGSPERR